jgi:hypothetical protein
MTPKFKTRIIAEHGPGRVTMSTCALCGWFEWRQTESDKPDDVIVKEHSPNGCPRCDAAFQRAPEVAAWVQGIVLKLRSDLAPKTPIFNAEMILDAANEFLRKRDIFPDVDTPQHRAVVEAVVAALVLESRAPRPSVAGHEPIVTADLLRIFGCSCGWKTPPDITDSDVEFTRHVAMERTF